MLQRHFLVESPELDHLAQEFCLTRRATESAYEEGGASERFMALGRQMSEAYISLYTALGMTQGYVVSPNGKRARMLRVERSVNRTVLSVPEGLQIAPDGVKCISREIYETMMEEAKTAMGMSAKALGTVPHTTAN